jgi:alkylhydroperoxidase family enzyme
VGSHAAVAAEFLGKDKVRSAIEGAGDLLNEKERTMMRLADIAGTVKNSSRVAAAPAIQAAIADCKRAGWSEAAIYDAITVIALFNFYNAWVDCAGVAPLTPEGYAASGQRLKARGYLMHQETAG